MDRDSLEAGLCAHWSATLGGAPERYAKAAYEAVQHLSDVGALMTWRSDPAPRDGSQIVVAFAALRLDRLLVAAVRWSARASGFGEGWMPYVPSAVMGPWLRVPPIPDSMKGQIIDPMKVTADPLPQHYWADPAQAKTAEEIMALATVAEP